MHALLPFIVAGVAIGSLYGMAATGLVLTYKTSGIFNFGHGALATAAAYVFYAMHDANHINWVISLVVSVLVLGVALGLVMEGISRRLAQQDVAWKVVGTVGLILIAQGLGTIKYGSTPISVDQFLPHATDFLHLGGVNVSYAQLTVALVGLVAVAGFYALFRWTRTGVAMRAVVDDSDLLAMQATSPMRVRRTAWLFGTTFAALSGVLLLPFIGLDSIALTYLVVQAFGAAAIGAFSSIPLTYAGAILLEIAANISQKYVVNVSWLSGLPNSLPFIILVIALLVLPRRRLVSGARIAMRPALQWQAPGRIRLGVGLIVVGIMAAVPTFVGGGKIGFFTIGMSSMMLLLSLGLLVRASGQVSLCHATFAAIGAIAFSQLDVQAHIPWFAALVLAGLIVVPIGALVAIPAIRLSGLFLALATLGFGIFVQYMLYSEGWMFTVHTSGKPVPRPSIASTNTRYYYLALILMVITALVMLAIREGRLGRLLRGLADSPVAAASMGLSTNTTRVIVFCISAFFAGLAGVVYGGSVHFAVSTDTKFQAFYSLTLLAILALSPFAEPWYAIFGLIAAIIPGYISSPTINDWLNAIFGISAIGVAMRGGHPMMPVQLREFIERLAPRPREKTGRVVELLRRPPTGQGLEVQNLGVAFGGLVAVSDLTLSVPFGRVTGLIGPNGAGKTTSFDAITGLNRRVDGRILLGGQDITRMPPAARGRLGIGRTFQRMALCDRLTVAENVALGREAAFAGGRVIGQLLAKRSESLETEAATWEAMDACGIVHLANVQAGSLSTGQRRLVELARCFAGSFDVILLDEPSSGLDATETEDVRALLLRIVQDRGCGVLLVEHDMDLVMNVCEYVYVLDFGRLMFEGTPDEVGASREVQAAYLGFEVDADEGREVAWKP